MAEKPLICKIRKDKLQNEMVVRHKPNLVAYCPRCGNIITITTSYERCEWCREVLDWSNRARGRFAGFEYIEKADEEIRRRYLV